jgi:thioredoxin reductase/NAD-dependent dihydropyrimidine dehydrogenase PreA subunit
VEGSTWLLSTLVYVGPLAATLHLYRAGRRRRGAPHLRALERARAEGGAEPASLHPAINPNRCLGCGACVRACPEGDVLGVVSGRAVLVHPENCIGHGACQTACPFDAITLVLGSETRGVEIPRLAPDFQTNVPGIFVAGELGGMGLIRNAVEQGRQAIDSIRSLPGIGRGAHLDVVIVGGGPAGIAASLAARAHGLRAVTLEQESVGGSVMHYPRRKLVNTAPVELPLGGRLPGGQIGKEELLERWEDAISRAGIEIREGERVEAVDPAEGGFVVRTAQTAYATRSVLLAIGRRGTPRKLGVAGEDLPHVVYRLVDPEQYRGQRVLVVGGGDSALEAAIALAALDGTRVTLSYRGGAFLRAGRASRQALERAKAAGRLEVCLGSEVLAIAEGSVRLSAGGRSRSLPSDAVVLCLGGTLPTAFLHEVGVGVETKRGTPLAIAGGRRAAS